MSVIILLFCLSVYSFAAEILEPVEVTATKKIENYNFSQVETIGEAELEQSSVPLVSQILEKVPGLVSSQNGGPGSRTTFFIRGSEARHVSFTLDGLKLNDTSNTDRQFDAAFLTLTSVEEIRVHKGPQAILYGSDAMGGHVEMMSRKGSARPEKKLTLTGGSFGTGGMAYRQDWSKGTVSVVRQRTDGISRFNKKRYDATERDGSEITQLTSSSTHELLPAVKTDILASFIEGRNELDVSRDSGAEKSRNHQYLLQQKSSLKLSRDTAISLRNGLNRNEREVKSLFSTQNFAGNLYQNEALLERGNEDARVITGLVSETETIQLSESKSFVLNSFFMQGLLKNDDFSFQGGLRGDHHSRYGNFVTGSTGVEMKNFAGTWALQYSRGYKAPSLYQLFGPPLTFYPIVGNKDLKPESNQSYEASWKLKSQTWEFENVIFQSRLSNLITFSTANGYLNQGRFIAEGIEPSLKWKNANGEIRGTFTHQRFRNHETKVLRRPYNMAQLSGSWFVTDASELFVKGRWFASRRDEYFQEPVKLNGFETFDIGGSYRWEKQMVSLQLINATNREYEELYGYSVMPRSIFGSYAVTF